MYLEIPRASFVKHLRLRANYDSVDLKASSCMSQDKITEFSILSKSTAMLNFSPNTRHES